jgi:hypothetical protein
MKAGRVDETVGIVKNDTPDLLTLDRVVDLPYRLLPDEELWELEGMDQLGEFDPPLPRKKAAKKTEKLKLEY